MKYNNTQTFIYALKRNGIIFYIGKTVDLKTRKSCHTTNYGKIEFCILHKTDGLNANELEKKVINEHWNAGCPLINKNVYPLKNITIIDRYLNRIETTKC